VVGVMLSTPTTDTDTTNDLPDTPGNAAGVPLRRFPGANRSALPKARVVALAERGTHAFLAAEIGAYSVGEKTLANRLYQRLCDPHSGGTGLHWNFPLRLTPFVTCHTDSGAKTATAL